MPALPERLASENERLIQTLARRAGWLLRFESAEDLAQGVHLRALERNTNYTDRGQAEFLVWLDEVTRQHLVTRARYWKAVKRDAGRMLRAGTSSANSTLSSIVIDPRASETGPITFAIRREIVELAARALDSLAERDRELVRMRQRGASDAEIAAQFELAEGSAQRAAHRAQERFERALRFLVTAAR